MAAGSPLASRAINGATTPVSAPTTAVFSNVLRVVA